MFEFNDFLARLELDPKRTRLLRHDLNGVAAWRRGGRQAFGCFASFQRKGTNSPYGSTLDTACHFLPGPTLADGQATALFIGSTRVIDRWDWDGERLPLIKDEKEIEAEHLTPDLEAFDLEWLEADQAYSEKILIRWGFGVRSWSQWANKHKKEILEIRMDAQVPPFPGFSKFRARISETPFFPQSWVGSLSSVKGVYLLVSDDGEQYVGSASGVDGFMGRWSAYSVNGHGGNILLKARGHKEYTVSILEVASPDMSITDIVAREAFWKEKLGSRAHGLNAN